MCTEFILPYEGDNPIIISGRTMDFAEGTEMYMVKVPVGHTATSTAPPGGKALSWKTKYGFVGIAAKPGGFYSFSDGLNTEGLSVAELWLTYTDYDGVEEKNAAAAVHKIEEDCEYLNFTKIIDYLLSTCTDVDQVRAELDNVDVWLPEAYEEQVPCHLSIHDRSGNSLVVEFIKGQKVYYNNKDIGVLANGPTYDWHAVHFNYFFNSLNSKDNDIDKYVQLKKDKSGIHNITSGDGFQYEVLGTGMFGLPGDSTSPARFVRAGKLRHCVPTDYDNRTGVQYALQVLGRITVCDREVLLYFDNNGKPIQPRNAYNPTLWKTVRDHVDRIYYYCTHLNQNIQAIKLNELDFTDGKMQVTTLSDESWYNDSTSKLK